MQSSSSSCCRGKGASYTRNPLSLITYDFHGLSNKYYLLLLRVIQCRNDVRPLMFFSFSMNKSHARFPIPFVTTSIFVLGRCLNFNSMIILVLVLRYTITKLRELGLSNVLPLDHNIYLHKVMGYLIFFQSWFHTIMHLFNFFFNVTPEP